MRLPNIVILYADDLGYGDVGCYNEHSKIPTPHLDQLARQGMRFTDGHSSSGICTPSRYALLTGRHHWRKFHGIVQAFGPSVFDDARLTMPEMLQRRGYRTACIGKWHLGWDWSGAKNARCQAAEGQGLRGGPVRLESTRSGWAAGARFRLLLRRRRAELPAIHVDRERSCGDGADRALRGEPEAAGGAATKAGPVRWPKAGGWTRSCRS